MRRAILLTTILFFSLSPLWALSDTARETMSMKKSEAVYARDPEIGRIPQGGLQDPAVRALLEPFFLTAEPAAEKSGYFLQETSFMAETLYGDELFGSLPAEDVRFGMPVASEGMRIPFRLFFPPGSEEATRTGMVFLLERDGQWKIAHIEM